MDSKKSLVLFLGCVFLGLFFFVIGKFFMGDEPRKAHSIKIAGVALVVIGVSLYGVRDLINSRD